MQSQWEQELANLLNCTTEQLINVDTAGGSIYFAPNGPHNTYASSFANATVTGTKEDIFKDYFQEMQF